MRAIVLKAFSYSTNGVTARTLEVGAEEGIVDDMAPGLEREGFIRPLNRDLGKKSARKPEAAKGAE